MNNVYLHPTAELIERVNKAEREHINNILFREFGLAITTEIIAYFRDLGREIEFIDLPVAGMLGREMVRRDSK